MKDLPCNECLKYSMCINKIHIKCLDLVDWLLEYDSGTDNRSHSISEFEKFWTKDIRIIHANDGSIEFKERRDNYSCLIV